MKTLDEVKQLLGTLPGADLPLALFPIQIQTRFVTRGGQLQLLVRVYPDEIHIDSHEEQLTSAEVAWGKQYWMLAWPAVNNQEIQQQAWRQMVDRFDARRAAWIIRRMTPTNLSQRPVSGGNTPAPTFPNPGALKTDSWTLPALARLLPARWVVAGYVGGTRVILETGAIIPEKLAVSLTPDQAETPAGGAGEEELAIDEGMRWMVNFEEAEKVGMGIRISLPAELIGQTIDRLLVYGINTGLDSQQAAGSFETQLDAHHFTRGLEFIAPGRPTNNSPEATSGISQHDPVGSSSFEVEINPPELGPVSDGALAARLLGIRSAVFSTVAGGQRGEDQDARSMQAALWHATGEYYLEQILAQPQGQPAAFTPDQIDEARRFFIDFVRQAGPLPTLRVGRQPYGLLPVQSLTLVAQSAAGKNRFVQTLLRMQPVWKTAARRAPRLQPGTQSSDDLVEILRMQPVSTGFRARPIFDSQFFIPSGVVQKELDPNLKSHSLLLQSRLKQLAVEDIVGDGRVFDLLPAQDAIFLGAALVQPGGEAASSVLSPNYITFLRTASFDDILNENFPVDGPLQGQPDALLYLLLRHSVLLAYVQTAMRILVRQGRLSGQPFREPVLVDILGTATPARTRTLLRILDLDPALRATLHTLGAAQEPEAAVLDELRASLAHLETMPVDKLTRQLCGCLDLFSYRLDAWNSALATRRLVELRQAQPTGLAVGGYGWVEDLQPAERTQSPSLPAGEEGPLFSAREPGGFIHAPSLGQASAAGVLRSGYLSQPGAGNSRPFAVDLSSRRVRLAQYLLDGIRQGQPLGALLGYRFERGLHDRKLDRFIEGFRRVSMLAALYQAQENLREVQALPNSVNKVALVKAAQLEIKRVMQRLSQRFQFPVDASTTTLEEISVGRVADGLALGQAFQAGSLSIDQAAPRNSSPISPAERAQIEAELRNLQAAIDALSDALTAESVYQMALGNPVRAAASVDTVVHSEIQPPELTFNRTPRPGAAVTHRLVTLFSGPAPAAPAAARLFRARAEPRLNAWLRQMLGELPLVRCQADFLDKNGKRIGNRQTIALSTLGIAHLDVVYLCAASQPGQPSDLERLLEYQFRSRAAPAIPPEARLSLVYERPATGFGAAQLSFGEFLEVANAFRKVILSTRSLTGRDLAQSESVPPAGLDAVEFKTRSDQAVDALRQAISALSAQRQAAADTSATDPKPILDGLRERMLDLFELGFADALPLSVRGAGPAEHDQLLVQAQALEREAGSRLAQIQAADAAFDRSVSDADQQVQYDLGRMRLVFGKAFLALPQVKPANAQELGKAFQASPSLQGADPLQALSWLQGASRVRPAVSRLDAGLSFAAALGRTSALELRVAQLPFQAGERWIGLPFQPGAAVPMGKLSLVAHLPQPFRPAQPLAGLLVDEWVEAVPTGEVTTGVSFQYDAPGARPPQAVLLAVTPPDTKRWDVDILEQTLNETLDQAHLRVLDPLALSQDVIAQRLLPATYVSLNLEGNTISTDFKRAVK